MKFDISSRSNTLQFNKRSTMSTYTVLFILIFLKFNQNVVPLYVWNSSILIFCIQGNIVVDTKVKTCAPTLWVILTWSKATFGLFLLPVVYLLRYMQLQGNRVGGETCIPNQSLNIYFRFPMVDMSDVVVQFNKL